MSVTFSMVRISGARWLDTILERNVGFTRTVPRLVTLGFTCMYQRRSGNLVHGRGYGFFRDGEGGLRRLDITGFLDA